MASVLSGFHFAAVEPQKVEALTPVSNLDRLGFGRMQPQFQSVQDHPQARGRGISRLS